MNILVGIPFSEGPISDAALSETDDHKPWVWVKCKDRPDVQKGNRIGIVWHGALRVAGDVVRVMRYSNGKPPIWIIYFCDAGRYEPISDTGKDIPDFIGWKPWEESP